MISLWSEIPFDRDRVFDRGQHPTGKGEVDEQTVNGGGTTRPRS